MQQLPLNHLFKRYSLGSLEKKDLEVLIFQMVLENYQSFHLAKWSREECTDFLCWLYPRISRAIEHYREQGASFDAYIGTMIRLSYKEYYSRQSEHKIVEYSCWNARAAEMEVHSPEPEYLDGLETGEDFKPVDNPRQVLLLLLKSYHFVSEDFVARVAPAIGMKKEELGGLIEKLKSQRFGRDQEIREFRERVYSQYYRCLSFQRRVQAASEGSQRHEKMKQGLIRARARLSKMRQRLSMVRLAPSNQQVARVLGIPKGTVDSNLWAIKSKWRRSEIEGARAGRKGGCKSSGT